MLDAAISHNFSSQFTGGILSSGNAMTEEYLENRFSRASRVKEDIVVEFSNDPALLHQYYLMREKVYINKWELNNFSGIKDEFDDKSKIVIARVGNLCVGGCRLTYKHTNSDDILPIEKEGVRLADVFGEVPSSGFLCSEASRSAILPEYQNSTVALGIYRTMVEHTISLGTDYTFFISPPVTARNNRKILGMLGVGMETRRDVVVPDLEEFEGIKMVVSVIDWAKESAKRNAANIAAGSEVKNEELA